MQLNKQQRRNYLSNKNNETYKIYTEQRLKVKEQVKKAKQLTWQEFWEKMETNRKGNQKLYYGILRSLRKRT